MPNDAVLNLWKKNLGSVPDWMWERADVETLILADNGLQEVSERVGQLKRLRTLDLGLLQAGAGVRGEFENRLKSVIEEVKASPRPIVLFIDEAHTVVGAGAAAGHRACRR